jgi:hypothetical protein
MTTAADYQWFADRPYGLAEAYCLTLVRGLTPAGFLGRVGARPGPRYAGLGPMFEPSMDVGGDGTELLIGVTPVPGMGGEWALRAEVNGYLGATVEVLRALSAGTVAVSVYRNFNATNRFYWAEDGDLRLDFTPAEPRYRDGSTPDAVLGLMRQVGFDLDDEDGMLEGSDEAALALAERLTGVRLTAEVLEGATFESGIAALEPWGY